MLIGSVIGALLLAGKVGFVAEGWHTSVDLDHGSGSQNSPQGAVVYAPDAQVAVYSRKSLRADRACAVGCGELVYFDLKQGREVATVDRSFEAEDQFAVSRDGRVVVCLLQPVLGKWESFDLAIWRPRESPLTLEPVGDLEVANPGDPYTGSFFWPQSWGAPALSPDASHVAFFAIWFPGEGQWARDVVMVLDLESKKLKWVPVPMKTSEHMGRDWRLGWDAKGEVVLMLLHGDYEDIARNNELGETKVVLAGAPEYALYRWVPGEQKVAKAASIVGKPLGFSADGELLVANADAAATKKSGPAAARVWGFGRAKVPVSGETGAAQGAAATIDAVNLPNEIVIDPKARETAKIFSIFVGTRRTYAVVTVDEGSTRHGLLVEKDEPPAR